MVVADAAETAGAAVRPGRAVVASEVFEARQAARRLLEEAEAEARRLREEAQGEADAVRSRAREDGRAEGLAAAAAERIVAAEERDRALSALRDDLLEAAVALAGRILEREVTAPGEVVAAAERALDLVRGRARVLLRCSPDDLEELRRAGTGRLAGPAVRLEAAPALGRGEVVVETEAGQVDARPGTQLEALRRALAEGG
jgi:flagellar biosynthesis/type III secretory pathway protein FliH